MDKMSLFETFTEKNIYFLKNFSTQIEEVCLKLYL